MSEHYIHRLSVKDLWGHENYDIPLREDVNIIIGPNASGKTTLINIIYNLLSANLGRLIQTRFSEVTVNLRSSTTDSERELQIIRDAESLVLRLDKEECRVMLSESARIPDGVLPNSPVARVSPGPDRVKLRRLQRHVRQLVSAVWLPVSRRLPIAKEEGIERRRLHRRPLESVDECLSGLIEDLQHYRLSLNAGLSELRGRFQLQALQNILYDKQHDGEFPGLESFIPPSEDDKKSLLKAFRDVGLTNRKVEERIDGHFAAARSAYANLRSKKPDLGSVFIIPLINRTRSIVGFAQELEVQREELFSALHVYMSTVNAFFSDKRVEISDHGELEIRPKMRDREPIDWRDLSSGEKQILILLTQALLSERDPVIYIADEPELSLHVTWQENLLKSLTTLAGSCQFIIATHSPDIVAEFGDNVIDLGHSRA